MTAARPDVVEHSLHIDARPEVVFRLLTDAQELLRWQGLEAEVDPQPGGTYRVKMNALGHTASGRFLEVTAYTRIVFTWGWESGDMPVPPGSSIVEITLAPEAGGTLLHLVHRDLPPADGVIEAHTAGWARYLARLAAVAEGRDPGPDDWAVGPPDELHSV